MSPFAKSSFFLLFISRLQVAFKDSKDEEAGLMDGNSVSFHYITEATKLHCAIALVEVQKHRDHVSPYICRIKT